MSARDILLSKIESAKNKLEDFKNKHILNDDIDEPIVDHIAAEKAKRAEEQTRALEGDIHKKLQDAKIITVDSFWGDKRRMIDLMATWGHERYYRVANLITKEMPKQPIRLLKGVLYTTSALAMIVAGSAFLSSVSMSNNTNLQALIIDRFGINYSTAVTLSEGKKAHVRWRMLERDLNSAEGKVDFEKFKTEVFMSVAEGQGQASVDLSQPSLDTAIWNEQLHASEDNISDSAKSLKLASADGFWSNPDAVKLLNENGVLVSSDGNTDKVAAIYKNGQLSVNIFDGMTSCWNVYGTPIDSSCTSIDLKKPELSSDIPTGTLISMFDTKAYSGKHQVASVEADKVDERWYLDLPDVSEFKTSYSHQDLEKAAVFLKNNEQYPFDTNNWKALSSMSVMPVKTGISGFFKDPNVIEQMAKSPVIAHDGNAYLIAGIVNGDLQARYLKDGYCNTIFGVAVDGCNYTRDITDKEAFLKSLYQPSDNQLTFSDVAMISKAALKTENRHESADDYFKHFVSVRDDFGNAGLDINKWNYVKRLKSKFVTKKAEGLLLKDNDELIRDYDIIAVANPENENIIGVLSSINGVLQLDVLSKERGFGSCYNVLGISSMYCNSFNLDLKPDVKEFVESLFN
ncbi:hypothetical protein [Brucella gallinifaecis]|uniref:hypothetical protein n=1 Tax=Brucella gallinifaecis TaxID=215590 RepID=UPI00236218E1|nr:hypothetical protein [Brucella gallinifaecis]